MSMHTIKEQLLALFRKSKKDRHRFLGNHLSANIAAQIFTLRTAEERNWTQAQLAKEAGIAQPRIPVYESPDYGAFSLTTLKNLAHAFDVALVVKFISFDELAKEIAHQSSENLSVSRFEDALIPQHERAVAQSANIIGHSSTIGDIVVGTSLGECKSIGWSGLHVAATASKQRPRARPINTMDQESQLVTT